MKFRRMTDQSSSSRNAQTFTADAARGDERMRFLDSLSQQIRRPLDGMLAVTDLLRRQPLSPHQVMKCSCPVQRCRNFGGPG